MGPQKLQKWHIRVKSCWK